MTHPLFSVPGGGRVSRTKVGRAAVHGNAAAAFDPHKLGAKPQAVSAIHHASQLSYFHRFWHHPVLHLHRYSAHLYQKPRGDLQRLSSLLRNRPFRIGSHRRGKIGSYIQGDLKFPQHLYEKHEFRI